MFMAAPSPIILPYRYRIKCCKKIAFAGLPAPRIDVTAVDLVSNFISYSGVKISNQEQYFGQSDRGCAQTGEINLLIGLCL
jgi:hypothetical protein